jgi:uncharacterized protein YuzE
MLLFGHFVKSSKDGFAKPNRDRGGWFADNAFARIANIFPYAHHHRRKCRFEDKMIQPIHVRVDLEAHAAYVKYAPGRSVSTIDLNDTSSVAYDVDADGTIVGIEVLEIQLPGQIEIAREFAEKHDLAFPRDLAGNLAAA